MTFKGKRFLRGWAFSTLACFFLYDLIWIFADFEDFKEFITENYYCISIDLAYCAFFSLLSILVSQGILHQRFSNVRGDVQKNLVVCAIILFAANLLVAELCESCFLYVDADFLDEDIWGNSYVFCLIASNIAMVHLSKHYAHMLIQKENDNIALQRKYLKLQLDPHFVLNSMSSLAGMIEQEPQTAVSYVVKLSHVYRHLLQHIDKDHISLPVALDFAKDYVDLLNLRYNGRIELEADHLTWKQDECILALSVQLLIENAVKHNHPCDDDILYIRMMREGEMLVIENNRIYAAGRNDQCIESYGVGLENLRRRYSLESSTLPEVSITKDLFVVRLPILTKK